jgi:cellulase
MRHSIILAASWASIAFAHGHVKEYIIDGNTYPAFDTNNDYDPKWKAKRVEWGFPKAKGNVGPVEDVAGLDINCRFRPLTVPAIEGVARAGANITFKWFDWFGNHKGGLFTVSQHNLK